MMTRRYPTEGQEGKTIETPMAVTVETMAATLVVRMTIFRMQDSHGLDIYQLLLIVAQ